MHFCAIDASYIFEQERLRIVECRFCVSIVASTDRFKLIVTVNEPTGMGNIIVCVEDILPFPFCKRGDIPCSGRAISSGEQGTISAPRIIFYPDAVVQSVPEDVRNGVAQVPVRVEPLYVHTPVLVQLPLVPFMGKPHCIPPSYAVSESLGGGVVLCQKYNVQMI